MPLLLNTFTECTCVIFNFFLFFFTFIDWNLFHNMGLLIWVYSVYSCIKCSCQVQLSLSVNQNLVFYLFFFTPKRCFTLKYIKCIKFELFPRVAVTVPPLSFSLTHTPMFFISPLKYLLLLSCHARLGSKWLKLHFEFGVTEQIFIRKKKSRFSIWLVSSLSHLGGQLTLKVFSSSINNNCCPPHSNTFIIRNMSVVMNHLNIWEIRFYKLGVKDVQ